MKNSNYIVYDFETGGFDAKRCAVTQFAAVCLEPHTLRVIDKINIYIKPYELAYEKRALEVTGIKMSTLRKKGIEVDDAIDMIVNFFKKNSIKGRDDKGFPTQVGHNLSFDIRFMRALLSRKKILLDDLAKIHFEDTMWMARKAFQNNKEQKISLGEVCKKIGINLEGAHDAMNDVMATAEVFMHFSNVMLYDGSVGATSKKKLIKYQF